MNITEQDTRECESCGWVGPFDEFDNLTDGTLVCEECWDVAVEADPTNYFERID